MSEPMRIQRALARAGVLSRRKAEELVSNGRVTVNGAPAKVGQSVDPDRDVIMVDGTRIERPAPLEWFLLHKPAGVITSRGDPEGRKTVFDLVPKRPGLTYVGRLEEMDAPDGRVGLPPQPDTAASATYDAPMKIRRVAVSIISSSGTSGK